MSVPANRWRTWLKIGLAGSLITALCCFTPLLVGLLGLLGLSALVDYLDLVLLPLLVLFIIMVSYALWLKGRH